MAIRPTLSSVAERAQVSRQTVSNVLNAPEKVLAETRHRVEDAITALGYRPHHGARALRTRRSQLIAVRMEPFGDGVSGSVLDRFLHALTEAAEQAGYRVLLFTATDDDTELAASDDLLTTHDLDAFVLTSTHHGDRRTAWLAERGVPFVTFGRPWGDRAGHSWVDVDGAAGTAEATDRLVEAGHRRVGFLGWPDDSDTGNDRRLGWSRALDAAGLTADLHRSSRDDDADEARAAASALLGDGATALVCASDSLALAALSVTERRGDGAPDVPVVGFDDTPVARVLGLSSVAQPLREAASACIQLLTDVIDGTAAEPRHVLLTPRLVTRRTGP